MSEEKRKLLEMCKPIAEYIQKHFHPHTSVVIETDRIKVEEAIAGCPVERALPTISLDIIEISDDVATCEVNLTATTSEKTLTKFDALRAISDPKKLADLIYDLFNDKSAEDIEKMLSENLTRESLSTLEQLEREGYPVCLSLKQ